MTPTREEAERLKHALTASLCPNKLEQQIAEFIDRQAAEIERLNSDRKVLQSTGNHPAPCARFCESVAFNIEIRQLKAEIERLNSELGAFNASMVMAANKKLRSELEALRLDAGRIDFIEAHINQHGAIYFHDGNNPRGIGIGLRPGNLVRALRQAIDTAMKQGETPC